MGAASPHFREGDRYYALLAQIAREERASYEGDVHRAAELARVRQQLQNVSRAIALHARHLVLDSHQLIARSKVLVSEFRLLRICGFLDQIRTFR